MPQHLQILGPTVLAILSIPLALLAIITTLIALFTLAFRVVLVYLELVFALLTSSLSRPANLLLPTSTPLIASTSDGEPKPAQFHRLVTRESAMAVMSPFHEAAPTSPLSASAVAGAGIASLVGPSDPTRDFEGVGGWRAAPRGQGDAVRLNARLQLPTATPTAGGGQRAHQDTPPQRKHHRRAHSAQSQRERVRPVKNPQTFRMSPVASRNRTPPAVMRGGDAESPEGYFAMPVRAPGEAAPMVADMDMCPGEAYSKMRMDQRRLSIGSSGASSTVDIKALGSAATGTLAQAG